MLLIDDFGLKDSSDVGNMANTWTEKSVPCSTETRTKGECIDGMDLQQS
jgi:hypothetical protein